MPRIVSWSEADGPVEAFARQLRADHPGETVDVPEGPLSDALALAGAFVGRRSFLMRLAPLPHHLDAGRFDGLVGPMLHDPERYAGPLLRAFPPEHPDYDPEIGDLQASVRALQAYFDGTVIGPFIDGASSEARTSDGQVVGGIVVARKPSDPDEEGGPWVTDVFVEPSHHGLGIGRALFARTITELQKAGEESLALAVHRDNPAHEVYLRLGFTDVSAWSRTTL